MQKSVTVLLLCGALSAPRALAAKSAPDLGDTWHNLAALPPHSEMHVSADNEGRTCYLIAVDEQSLTCGRKDGSTKGQHVYPRPSVKSVKLTRYGISTLAGAGIGAGVGATIGFAGTQNPNGWFNGAIRGVLTGLGAGVGALVCGPTDVFRGPTIYKRMSPSR
jgi:hypothetical protein